MHRLHFTRLSCHIRGHWRGCRWECVQTPAADRPRGLRGCRTASGLVSGSTTLPEPRCPALWAPVTSTRAFVTRLSLASVCPPRASLLCGGGWGRSEGHRCCHDPAAFPEGSPAPQTDWPFTPGQGTELARCAPSSPTRALTLALVFAGLTV